jgi:choice-of-anchor A domain-containing protein
VAGGFDTVVGGAFNFSNGTVYGKVSSASATVTGAGVCAGCLSTSSASPLNFSAVAAQGQAENSFLYTLTPTGSVTKPYSTLMLNASGSSLLQVFSITSAQLSGNSGIDITGLAANATVVINVTDNGTHTAQTSSAGLQINGTQVQSASNVLFNFADTFTGISIANSFTAAFWRLRRR